MHSLSPPISPFISPHHTKASMSQAKGVTSQALQQRQGLNISAEDIQKIFGLFQRDMTIHLADYLQHIQTLAGQDNNKLHETDRLFLDPNGYAIKQREDLTKVLPILEESMKTVIVGVLSLLASLNDKIKVEIDEPRHINLQGTNITNVFLYEVYAFLRERKPLEPGLESFLPDHEKKRIQPLICLVQRVKGNNKTGNDYETDTHTKDKTYYWWGRANLVFPDSPRKEEKRLKYHTFFRFFSRTPYEITEREERGQHDFFSAIIRRINAIHSGFYERIEKDLVPSEPLMEAWNSSKDRIIEDIIRDALNTASTQVPVKSTPKPIIKKKLH